MKTFCSVIMSLLLVLGARAENTQILVTKSGNTYFGYVSAQLSHGRIEFASESAVINVAAKCPVVDSYKTTLKKLPAPVQKWLQAQGFDEASRAVQMSKVTVGEQQMDSVYVIERGSRTRFISVRPSTDVFTWSEIASISSGRNNDSAGKGVNVRYHFKDNTSIEGEYAGETENSLSLYTSNGMIETCNLYDVVKYEYYTVGKEKNLLKASPKLDIVKTKDGKIAGVIKEKNYQSATSDGYYFVITTSEGDKTVKLSDVIEIRKAKNTFQDKESDMKAGQIMVNGVVAQQTAVTQKNGILYADTQNKVDISAGKVVIEYLSTDKTEKYPVVRMERKGKNTYYFTYEDLFRYKAQYSPEENEYSNTFKARYSIYEAGMYAIYDKDNNTCVIFSVN